MKKVTILLVCLMALPLFGEASHEELASRFFRINTPEESVESDLFDQMDQISPYLNGTFKTEEGSSSSVAGMDSLKGLIDFFMRDFSYEELERVSIPIIISQYSAAELEALNSFLQSPAGAAYLVNSKPSSSYLAQAMKTYLDQKAQDEDWVMGLVMSLFSNLGLSEGAEGDSVGSFFDWSWQDTAEPDTVSVDYWDEPAYSDTLSYNDVDPDDSWEDYWGGPMPTTISLGAISFNTLDQYLYIFNNILPVFKQMSGLLTAYYDEYGGYPNELDWSQIKPVMGFDLEYLHDSVLLKATSNKSFDLQDVEIIYYMLDDSIWMSIPKKL